jgi:hypothetical protein
MGNIKYQKIRRHAEERGDQIQTVLELYYVIKDAEKRKKEREREREREREGGGGRQTSPGSAMEQTTLEPTIGRTD